VLGFNCVAESLLLRCSEFDQIVEFKDESGFLDLGHLQSSCRVQYNVTGWTKIVHQSNSQPLLTGSSRCVVHR
jgi:hypothetical protein